MEFIKRKEERLKTSSRKSTKNNKKKSNQIIHVPRAPATPQLFVAAFVRDIEHPRFCVEKKPPPCRLVFTYWLLARMAREEKGGECLSSLSFNVCRGVYNKGALTFIFARGGENSGPIIRQPIGLKRVQPRLSTTPSCIAVCDGKRLYNRGQHPRRLTLELLMREVRSRCGTIEGDELSGSREPFGLSGPLIKTTELRTAGER